MTAGRSSREPVLAPGAPQSQRSPGAAYAALEGPRITRGAPSHQLCSSVGAAADPKKPPTPACARLAPLRLSI